MQGGVARRALAPVLLAAAALLTALAALELLVESRDVQCWGFEECLTKATALLARAVKAAVLLAAALAVLAAAACALSARGEQRGRKVRMR